MRHGHDDVFGFNQVEDVDVVLADLDNGATLVAVLLTDRDQFVADHLQQTFGAFEDLDQVGDGDQQRLVFVGELFLFQPGQAVQAHFQDLLRLDFRQLVTVIAQADVGCQRFRLGCFRARSGEQGANHARFPASCGHALARFVA